MKNEMGERPKHSIPFFIFFSTVVELVAAPRVPDPWHLGRRV